MLIVVGGAVVAVELVRRAGSLVTAPAEDYARATVTLPAGARVLGVAGGGDALSLLVEVPGGGQRIVTVDRRMGAILGDLALVPRP